MIEFTVFRWTIWFIRTIQVGTLCSCSLEVELPHFFLCCYYFTNIHSTLLDEIVYNDSNILSLPTNLIVEVLLYGIVKRDKEEPLKNLG